MNDTKPSLILIGLRACGKSTIGARVAEALGWAFVDLDDVTSSLLASRGAGDAIETHGIDAFRDAEALALGSVLENSQQHAQVISLGGGTPTAPGCDEKLRKAQAAGAGRVIYLRATPATLQDRLMHTNNADRPALVGTDVIDEVQALFDQRDGLYQSIAESIVHVDRVSEGSVLAAVMALANADLESNTCTISLRLRRGRRRRTGRFCRGLFSLARTQPLMRHRRRMGGVF